MVSGLLLIALTFFVFAQAAFTRSGGQSAADAAALAAAREARDSLHDRFLEAADAGDADLGDLLDGLDFRTAAACTAAAELAGSNNATVVSCEPAGSRPGYRVTVETLDTVGESVIPGTENATATATAVAVIENLCRLENVEEDDEGDDGGDDDAGEDGGDDGDDAELPRWIELGCEDRDWGFDPAEEDELPEPRDLFRIHLED
ncbi:hypothetical protein [Streptomyces sp. SM14]|uniref:hypothetical protein n=1 Tax=Streptomyces sp. SM14 TaxID=1736045 RepID=UPI000CD58FAF|nr:hypothetical protein [Streptomyces sp. SM14]